MQVALTKQEATRDAQVFEHKVNKFVQHYSGTLQSKLNTFLDTAKHGQA